MKGSLTVEASYIFPFCFIVIMFVGYLGIFQYNQAVLKVTAYESILRTMEEREMGEEILKENIVRRAEEFGTERTLGVENLEAAVKITPTKISLTYSCVQRMLDSPIEVTVVYERIYPELTLRMARGIMGE